MSRLYLLLLLALIAQFTRALQTFEALDQRVWRSRAVVTVDESIDHICEFFDIEMDTVTLFFKARNHTAAVLDLYQCCTKSQNGRNGNCTNTSIHPSFCRCFCYERFFPSVYYYYREEVKNRHSLPGVTWFMNHYSWTKNPDHFMMKVLEFRALIANQPYVNDTTYRNQQFPALPAAYKALPLPEQIDHLVSQDYPVSTLTDYEKFVINIVYTSLNRTIPYITFNPKSRLHFQDYLTKSQRLQASCLLLRSQRFDSRAVEGKEAIYSEIMEDCRNHEKHKKKYLHLGDLWHGDHVYLSPRYKNNIPRPTDISVRTFQESVGRLMRSLGHSWSESEGAANTSTVRKNPVVAVLQRIEGVGPRSMLNLNDVGREIQKIFRIVELKIWYISEDTPAVEQATLFHSADIIISTHSSQLTNLVFSRPGTSVIEIQPEIGQEYSFRNIGVMAGMNYYMLNKGHRYDKSRDQSTTENSFTWRLWDYYVNITQLSEILQTIKKNHHYYG